MTLNWSVSDSSVFSQFDRIEDEQISLAVCECIDKAVSFLSKSIQDDSMYLLFDWQAENASLSILVTDETKQSDSKYVVVCQFSGVQQCTLNNNESQLDYIEKIHYSIKDYLTTCPGFLAFSLVAVFRDDVSESSRIL